MGGLKEMRGVASTVRSMYRARQVHPLKDAVYARRVDWLWRS